MKNTIELDTKILNKNLEITKLTTQLDNLTSELVDLKVKICDGDVQLHYLLTEIYERFFPMMEYCERLQPVEVETDNPGTEDHYTSIVNITDEEEMMKTKLFRLDDVMVHEDQTSRSILKDLRKVIKSLE
tara:strand:- start:703 stop:1092 length:390 start_codon:yes stop_codon:yes gene_type:complete